MLNNTSILKNTRPVLDGFTSYLQVLFCLIIASFLASAPSSIYEVATGNPLFFKVDIGEPVAFTSENVLISTLITLFVLYLSSSIQVGISQFCLDIYNGKGINFTTTFNSFDTIKPLVVTLILTVVIMVGFILLIIPGVILALMYSQVYYILAENPNIGILETFKKSEKLMRGKKLQLFVFSLRFMFYAFLGIFTLFIWWIWLIPRYSVAFAGFYEELKKDIVGQSLV